MKLFPQTFNPASMFMLTMATGVIIFGFYSADLHLFKLIAIGNKGHCELTSLESLQRNCKINLSDATEPTLLAYIKEKYMTPPSFEPYALKEFSNDSDREDYLRYKEIFKDFPKYKRLSKLLYDGKPPGFFVEAGALDGEYLSNTLYLERELRWKGLLVEANKYAFDFLMRKHRKAWSSNTCLATQSYPHTATLLHINTSDSFDYGNLGRSMMSDSTRAQESGDLKVKNIVQCFTLQSLVLSLGVRKIDLFSLDVEGVEEAILSTYFVDKELLPIDVFFVEHFNSEKPGEIDSKFVNMFIENNFQLYAYFPLEMDYVFIRNESPILKEALLKRPKEWETSV